MIILFFFHDKKFSLKKVVQSIVYRVQNIQICFFALKKINFGTIRYRQEKNNEFLKSRFPGSRGLTG